MLTFSCCYFSALVDLLIKMTSSWEAERNKVFLYDQVRYLTLFNSLNSLFAYTRKYVLKKAYETVYIILKREQERPNK